MNMLTPPVGVSPLHSCGVRLSFVCGTATAESPARAADFRCFWDLRRKRKNGLAIVLLQCLATHLRPQCNKVSKRPQSRHARSSCHPVGGRRKRSQPQLERCSATTLTWGTANLALTCKRLHSGSLLLCLEDAVLNRKRHWQHNLRRLHPSGLRVSDAGRNRVLSPTVQ